MPYTTIIATAGISALTSRNVLGTALRHPDSPVGFTPGKQNPEPKESGLDDEQVILECLDFLDAQPTETPPGNKEISAEFSIFAKLREAGLLADRINIHLIHTPSLGGRLAIEAQTRFWEDNGAHVFAEELSVPFDPAAPGGLALASGAFMGKVSQLLSRHTPHDTVFAPIGGYKVLVTLGHTAASFHGFSSLYLHEDSQVLQTLAPAPVALPQDSELLDFSRHLGNQATEINSLSQTQLTCLERHPGFFTQIDGLVELNELGQFLRLNEIPILLSPQAAAELAKETRLLKSQLHQIRDLACQNPEHPGINHDFRSTSGRAHPWRLARMGVGHRFAWQIHENQILIQTIWRDHDLYEREAGQNIAQPLPAALNTYSSL